MNLQVRILEPAETYIVSLKESEQGALLAQIEALQAGDFTSITTKQLRGKIRELKMGSHRITYFQKKNELYLIRGFLKKSAKTPKREIDYAESIYRQIK